MGIDQIYCEKRLFEGNIAMKDFHEDILKLQEPGYSKKIGEYNKILSRCVSDMPPVVLGDIKVIPNMFHFSYEPRVFLTGLHQHNFYELSFAFLSFMDYEIQGRNCRISDKDNFIVLIPDKLIHKRTASAVPALICGYMLDIVALNDDGEKILPEIKNIIEKTGFRFAIPSKAADIRECLLDELKVRSPFFTDKIKILLHNFLFEMFREYFGHLLWLKRNPDGKPIAYERTKLTYAIKTFVEENLASPFSVKEVAERFHLCKRHLNRIFTDQTDIPLGKYIIQRKMEAAKKMLKTPNPDTKVKQIAYALGYKEVSYFCRIFKKAVGISPSEYGKSNFSEQPANRD